MIVGYRKFGLAVSVIVIATGLVIWGKITSPEFVQLVTWISGLYFGANVGAKVADKVQVTPKTETTTTVTSDKVKVETG